jgi:hypothetical protein
MILGGFIIGIMYRMVRAIVNTNNIEKFEGEIISDNYELSTQIKMDYENNTINNSNFVDKLNTNFVDKLINYCKISNYSSTRNYCINADTSIFNNNTTNISPTKKCKTNNEDKISTNLKTQTVDFWNNLFLKNPQIITIDNKNWNILLSSIKISNQTKCRGFISKKCTYTYTINIKIIAKLCIYNECTTIGGKRTKRKRNNKKRKTRVTRK